MLMDAILNILLASAIPGVMAVAAVVMSLRPSPLPKFERYMWLLGFGLFVVSLWASPRAQLVTRAAGPV